MPDDEWLVSGSTSIDEIRGYYEALAASYDTTLASWGYDAPWRSAELLLASLGDDGSAQTVLDAGCGTGLAGQALRDAGFGGRLLGVDLSPESVALAIERGITTRWSSVTCSSVSRMTTTASTVSCVSACSPTFPTSLPSAVSSAA